MDESASRAYIAEIRHDLRLAASADDYEATLRQAQRLMRQRDERGWIPRLAPLLFMTPILLLPQAWRAAREGLVPHWGADLDWRADEKHGTILHDCSKLNKPRAALALIQSGADASLRGDDGRSALWHLRRSAQASPSWSHKPELFAACLEAAGWSAALKEREILEGALDGPPEIALAQPAAKPRRL